MQKIKHVRYVISLRLLTVIALLLAQLAGAILLAPSASAAPQCRVISSSGSNIAPCPTQYTYQNDAGCYLVGSGPSGQSVQPTEVNCTDPRFVTGSTSGNGSNQFVYNPAGDCETKDSGNCITDDLQVVINFIAAGVGIIIVIMFIWGGVQYSTAGNNPQTVQAARKKILNALIALAAFVFVYAFLQFIVPGGLFHET